MGIRVDQNILNQKGTPAFNAAPFSARPTAGFLGRIFISTDTYEIFRDESVGWSLIADAGAGSGTLESVTFNGNNTPYGINITNGGLFLLGSTNGSIFFAAGGSGQFTTDSTNFFWDDTNNRLGIGTAAPSARLDVHSSSGTSAILNGTGVSNALLTFQSAGVNKWSVGNFVSSTVADDFNIYDAVNTISRLQVHNTGVVNIPTSLIIGTTTPTSIYSLDVTGSGRFTSALLASSTITGSAFIPSGATVPTNGMYLSAANTLAFSTNSTNQLSIASTGLASFNYNTSGTALKITTSYASGRVANFGFGDGSILPTASFYIGNQTGVGVYIGDETSATKGLYVTAAGLIGIGTTSPANLLQLAGASAIPSLRLSSSSNLAFYWDIGRENASTGDFVFNNAVGASSTERMRITAVGNVTIGNPSPASATTSLSIYSSTSTSFSSSLYCLNSAGGNTFIVRGDGKIFIGQAPNTTALPANLVLNGTEIQTSVSSIKYKTDVRDYDKGLDIIKQMRPVYYKGKNDGNKDFAGLIAEDIHELGLTEFVVYAADESPNALSYANMVALLVKGIQELNEKLVKNNIN